MNLTRFTRQFSDQSREVYPSAIHSEIFRDYKTSFVGEDLFAIMCSLDMHPLQTTHCFADRGLDTVRRKNFDQQNCHHTPAQPLDYSQRNYPTYKLCRLVPYQLESDASSVAN